MTGRLNTDKPLVIGASGLVGGAVYAALSNAIGTYATQEKPGLLHCTMDNIVPFLEEHKPTIVFLASALTYVDYCEENPGETMQRNVAELQPLVAYCKEHDVPLVFFSTDYIFDGTEGPYAEDASPRPLNVYGVSKLKGEQLVKTLDKHAIVRITNVFDIGFDEKNFLHRLVTSFRDGKELVLPDDQLATPTYATWLGQQLVALLNKGLCTEIKTINIACDEQLSRVDFAEKVAKLLNADTSLIKSITTAALQQKADRPLQAGLRNDMLKKLLDTATLSVDDALQDVLPRMQELYGKR